MIIYIYLYFVIIVICIRFTVLTFVSQSSIDQHQLKTITYYNTVLTKLQINYVPSVFMRNKFKIKITAAVYVRSVTATELSGFHASITPAQPHSNRIIILNCKTMVGKSLSLQNYSERNLYIWAEYIRVSMKRFERTSIQIWYFRIQSVIL